MEHIKFKEYWNNSTKPNIEDIIYGYINDYPTWSEYGFIPEETEFVVNEIKANFPWNEKKWDDAMMGNTGMIMEGKFITYHCDVVKGVLCAVENRDLRIDEFD